MWTFARSTASSCITMAYHAAFTCRKHLCSAASDTPSGVICNSRVPDAETSGRERRRMVRETVARQRDSAL